MNTKKYNTLFIVSLIVVSFLIVSPAFAQTNKGVKNGTDKGAQKPDPTVMGTVTANNGGVITISRKQNNTKDQTSTTLTVNISSTTKVLKDDAAITVSEIAVGDTLIIQGTISGSTITATVVRDGIPTPSFVGTVTSISGTTITMTAKNGPKVETATVYTVEASGAKIIKDGTASSVSAIAVGDTIMVNGTATKNNIVAKTIRDGNGQGDGQPIVMGSVTAINGSTITITNKSNVVYTVDATNSKFVIGGVKNPTISNIVVGDSVVVQGTVNGNSVTASSIVDQKEKSENNQPKEGFISGMMRNVGGFFKHMFGF